MRVRPEATVARALGLGPLIGERTAGAGIWLSDRNRLVDHGIARVAESAQFDASGRWIIEGHGVDPDVEVDDPPVASFRGEDAQLDTAIRLLKEKLQEQPVTEPVPQAIPPVGESAAGS